MNDIDAVINQLEQQREAIDTAVAALRNIGGSSESGPRGAAPAQGGPRRRMLTPAGRKRIAEAARRRWAEKRAAEGGQAKAVKKGRGARKNQITPAGRRRLAEAMRKRWAVKRASQAAGKRASKKTAGARKASKKAASKQTQAA